MEAAVKKAAVSPPTEVSTLLLHVATARQEEPADGEAHEETQEGEEDVTEGGEQVATGTEGDLNVNEMD